MATIIVTLEDCNSSDYRELVSQLEASEFSYTMKVEGDLTKLD